jgi:signal transduction histidine kinase
MPAGEPERYVRLVRRRAVLVDVAVALGAFTLSAAVVAGHGPLAADLRHPDAGAYVLLALYSGSVALRRLAAIPAVVVGLLAGAVYAAAAYPPALTPAALLPVYTAAAVLPAPSARRVLAGSVVLALLGATFAPGPTDVGIPALVVAAWLLGHVVGSRRAYTEALERQNRLLEAAQQELAERAVADERLRIARELHDVVAHTMSVVALHAGTGRMVAEDDPAAARQALATIETASRGALLEMRRLLGVLRGSGSEAPAGMAPAPGLADLDALVADVVRSGVAVEVRVEGDRSDVPAGVDLSAYRIVQEALTNVLKHAGGARVTVVVRYAPDAVTVEVDDEGPARARAVVVPSAGGHGLAGMRERVALYHGDLEVGHGPTGGFHVSARLPFRDPA